MYEAAVLGATGYTGAELIRLLKAHPAVELVYLSSESHVGENINDVHPQFRGQVDMVLKPMQVDLISRSVDIVFCALPHGKSLEVVPDLLKKGFRVIDLSADFRLKEPSLYQEWYSLNHPDPLLLAEAVYGLPELNKNKIAGAKLVANPGCYPTSIILALAPLIQARLLVIKSVIIDAKSGVSGAGRAPKQPFHFPDCTENFKAYRAAEHQHTPEIEQELSFLAGENLKITFVPHLVPMIRGILSTIYVELTETEQGVNVFDYYADFYRDKPFVRIFKEPNLPETRFVRGSNYCDIALKPDRRTGRLIIISAIDNLLKGASGQAVQNMNIMLGLPETEGLYQTAI